MVKRTLLLVFGALIFNAGALASDGKADSSTKTPETPAVVQHSLAAVGAHPNQEVFFKQAREQLWDVYQADESSKQELLSFASNAPDGPGVGFAVLALIPFHDPETVKPLLARALDPKTTQATRWSILNSTPYVLSMGDVMYMSEGKLDDESKEMAAGIQEVAVAASTDGVGRAHAGNLRRLYDIDDPKAKKDSDYGLALWHQSAYLVGVLDERDEKTLDVFFDPKHGYVFANVISALAFASNRDFLKPLRGKKDAPVQEQQVVALAARDWWRQYAKDHTTWSEAIRSGFVEAGYHLENDLRSPQSVKELSRAIQSDNEITRYNAYRLLNETCGTRFDLERIFVPGKYALSFLDPSPTAQEEEKRLKKYWIERLAKAN